MVVYASSHNEGLVIETEIEQETKLLYSVLEIILRSHEFRNDDKATETEIEFATKLAEELHTYLVGEELEATE